MTQVTVVTSVAREGITPTTATDVAALGADGEGAGMMG